MTATSKLYHFCTRIKPIMDICYVPTPVNSGVVMAIPGSHQWHIAILVVQRARDGE